MARGVALVVDNFLQYSVSAFVLIAYICIRFLRTKGRETNNMDFEHDCAGAIICPIQPPRFGIYGQRTKARCIGCPHAAFCSTRNDVMARMDEIRQSITNETTKE